VVNGYGNDMSTGVWSPGSQVIVYGGWWNAPENQKLRISLDGGSTWSDSDPINMLKCQAFCGISPELCYVFGRHPSAASIQVYTLVPQTGAVSLLWTGGNENAWGATQISTTELYLTRTHNGHCYQSLDGGASWGSILSLGGSNPLYVVHGVAGAVVAAGRGGGGVNPRLWNGAIWTALGTPAGAVQVNGIFVRSATDIWACGYDTGGAIWHYDGSWTKVDSFSGNGEDIVAINDQELICSGRNGTTVVLRYSDDNGSSWAGESAPSSYTQSGADRCPSVWASPAPDFSITGVEIVEASGGGGSGGRDRGPTYLAPDGGYLIRLTGTFPINDPYEVFLGPSGNADDPSCYGTVGYGYLPQSIDGVTLDLVSPSMTATGAISMSLRHVGGLLHAGPSFTVVERSWHGREFGMRVGFPPWTGVGSRRLEDS
jgi:hypothetical protein